MYCKHPIHRACPLQFYTDGNRRPSFFFFPFYRRGLVRKESPRVLRLWMSGVWRSDRCSGSTAPLRLCAVTVCCHANTTCSSNCCTPSALPPVPRPHLHANADLSHSRGNADTVAMLVCDCAHTAGRN